MNNGIHIFLLNVDIHNYLQHSNVVRQPNGLICR